MFLRAQILPVPERTEIRQFLREYVDVRLAAVQEGQLESGIRRSSEICDELWKRAVAVAEKDPRSVPIAAAPGALTKIIGSADLTCNTQTKAFRYRGGENSFS